MSRTAVAVLALAIMLVSGVASSQTADAPDASVEGSRSWLSSRSSAPPLSVATKDTAPSPWRSAALLLVLAGLGGGALYMRLKRRKTAPKRETPALSVVATTRVGPKAHAVMARVGGRTLLLGVTDHSVQRIAWLEDEPKPEAEAAEDEQPDLWDGPETTALHAPAERQRRALRPTVPVATTVQSPQRAGFRDVLMTALGRPADAAPARAPAPRTAALAIAEETQDRYVPSRRRDEVVEVESQAAGLIARLDGLS